MIEVDAALGTDVGRKYEANFDVGFLQRAPLLAVVADGMGSSEGSAVAGRTAVDTFVEGMHAAGGAIGAGTIRDAVALAQARVIDAGRSGRLGLTGCTLTALVDGGDGGWWIAQVGDSRVYRLRGDTLELLTVDHTNAWIGVSHGIYAFDSPEAARGRYALHRYVGHPRRPEPDVLSIAPAPGDTFLLCTDGIADQVPFLTMREILLRNTSAESTVEELLATAGAEGDDNATALVVALG